MVCMTLCCQIQVIEFRLPIPPYGLRARHCITGGGSGLSQLNVEAFSSVLVLVSTNRYLLSKWLRKCFECTDLLFPVFCLPCWTLFSFHCLGTFSNNRLFSVSEKVWMFCSGNIARGCCNCCRQCPWGLYGIQKPESKNQQLSLPPVIIFVAMLLRWDMTTSLLCACTKVSRWAWWE